MLVARAAIHHSANLYHSSHVEVDFLILPKKFGRGKVIGHLVHCTTMTVAQANQKLSLVKNRAVNHGIQPFLCFRFGYPLAVIPNHFSCLGIHAENMFLGSTYDLTVSFPFYDTWRAIGGFVSEAFGLPNHLASEFIKGRHTDFLATGCNNNLTAID